MKKKAAHRPKGTTKKGVIKYLNDEQLQRFKKAIAINRRDDFLFSLMLYVGIRVQEIVNLKLTDIDESTKKVTIQGVKKGKTRTYTLPGKLWRKYQRWMKDRMDIEDSKNNPYLFITAHSLYDKPMSREGVQWLFKQHAKEAELNDSFSVHALRHTTAIVRVRAGHSAVRIMKWLRHSYITSTQVYFELAGKELEEDEEEAKEAFDKYI